MAKIKIDMSNVKQFLFEKGEKVALIACAAIMILVVVMSLWSGFIPEAPKSGKTWEKEISDQTQSVRGQISSVSLRPEDIPPPIDPGTFTWFYMPSNYFFVPLFALADKVSSKKLNPKILQPLPADDKAKQMHVDYVRGLYHCWHIDVAGKKAFVHDEKGGGGPGMGAGPGAAMAAAGGGAKGVGGGAGAGGGLTNLVKGVKPVRMLVVSAVFPMREQLDEYRKALRYATLEELLTHRDELPRPIGIEVMRVEIGADGKPLHDWKPLLKFDEKSGKLTTGGSLKSMMREMLIDEDEPGKMAMHVFPGMVMPLPKLANAKYRKVDLKDFEVKDMVAAEDGGKPGGNLGAAAGNQFNMAPKGPPGGLNMPGKGKPGGEQAGAGGGGGAGQPKPVAWAKLAKEFQDKFGEKYFPETLLDPLGHPPVGGTEKKGASVGGVGVTQPAPGQMNVPGGAAGAAASQWGWDNILVNAAAAGAAVPNAPNPGENADPNKAEPQAVTLYDALIRFYDPDVQAGKKYRYSFRVRMANPNYNKKNDVAYAALADQKELDWKDPAWQGWTITPEITTLEDFAWYAVDVTPDPKIKGGADAFPPSPGARPETTPVQVHNWLDKVADETAGTWPVGDWAVAERLYLRRGDLLGRQNVMVEVPHWNESLQAFEIAQSAQIKARPKGPQAKDGGLITSGIGVNLLTTPPAIVVDFEGGKKPSYSYEKRDGSRENIAIADHVAVDVLVLTPEGKLIARNSRSDSEAEERTLRFGSWRERLHEVRTGGTSGAGGAAGPAMPGGGR